MKTSFHSAQVITANTAIFSWTRTSLLYALFIAALVILCMPVRANAITEHVFYVSQNDFHVRELYYNGRWWGNDLTAATKGPIAGYQALTGFWDGHAEHVSYISRPITMCASCTTTVDGGATT